VLVADATFTSFLAGARRRTEIEAFAGVIRELAWPAVMAPAVFANLTFVAALLTASDVFANTRPVCADGVWLFAEIDARSRFDVRVLTRRIADARAVEYRLAIHLAACGAAPIADNSADDSANQRGFRPGAKAERRSRKGADNPVSDRAICVVAKLVAI
jgi:hypothetical protein